MFMIFYHDHALICLIVRRLIYILSLSRKKERFRSAIPARLFSETLVNNHVYCNRLYPGWTTYFYLRAVIFYVLSAETVL